MRWKKQECHANMTTDNLKIGDRVLFSEWHARHLGGDIKGEWLDKGEAIITATTDGAVKLDFGRVIFYPINGWYRISSYYIKIEKVTNHLNQ